MCVLCLYTRNVILYSLSLFKKNIVCYKLYINYLKRKSRGKLEVQTSTELESHLKSVAKLTSSRDFARKQMQSHTFGKVFQHLKMSFFLKSRQVFICNLKRKCHRRKNSDARFECKIFKL